MDPMRATGRGAGADGARMDRRKRRTDPGSTGQDRKTIRSGSGDRPVCDVYLDSDLRRIGSQQVENLRRIDPDPSRSITMC